MPQPVYHPWPDRFGVGGGVGHELCHAVEMEEQKSA